ncbi:MAG: acyl-CoA reductase, partial [Spongiibacteraceae bacterium]
IQPGLELISLDPKRSSSIVGVEAFANEKNMRDAARRIAADIGSANQNGCVNARVIYCMSGTDDAGVERLKKLGQYTYDALMNLPVTVSTRPKGGIKGELADHLETLLLDDEFYEVNGGQDNEGAIVVSKLPTPVEFAELLNDRVGNLVPVDDLDSIIKNFDAYTQSVGIYPDSLLLELRDRIPLYGVQRIVSLGYTGNGGINFAQPQDSVEIFRRMLKWIVNEEVPPNIQPLWEAGDSAELASG